jgi:hypothetical protein
MMALKDLAASRSSVNEDVIEEIVKDFVRYDVDDQSIVLTPEASKLTVRQKILTYLTANEGWCYVNDGIETPSVSPKALEEPLGAPGGTVRGKLAELAKDNLIKKDGRGYRIRTANLTRIRKEVLGL